MVYENPEIPEGINTSSEHPLKEFIYLLVSVSAILLVIAATLSVLTGWLVRYIPFAQEQMLANSLPKSWSNKPLSAAGLQKQQYLQKLANGLATRMGVSPDMPIRIHYSAEQNIGAFATLGGHIVVYQGLINTLSSENALAMALAHEIAHAHHRDTIVAMGQSFTVMAALTAITGISDLFLQHWLNSIDSLTSLSFSREQEMAADKTALQTLQAYYGHTYGADEFFLFLLDNYKQLTPELLSTHPNTEARVALIRLFQQQHQTAPTALRPLPEYLSSNIHRTNAVDKM